MTDYLSLSRTELGKRAFTPEGATYFEKVLREFSAELEVKSIAQANSDTVPGMKLEVGPDPIRRATHALFARPRKKITFFSVVGNVGEYLCAIVAGFAGGQLTHPWAVPVLVGSAALGVVLLVARMLYVRGE